MWTHSASAGMQSAGLYDMIPGEKVLVRFTAAEEADGRALRADGSLVGRPTVLRLSRRLPQPDRKVNAPEALPIHEIGIHTRPFETIRPGK